MKKTNFLKTKEEISAWLEQYAVRNCTLFEDPTYGYVVNVEGSVDLIDKLLSSIPVKFNIVKGNFNCRDNFLTSLDFAPHIVKGSFYCASNNLISLEFSPSFVQVGFYCQGNKLTSLEFCPKTIQGDFDCSYNQVNTWEFCPETVVGHFYYYHNPALGENQNIKDFFEILKIQQETLIKKEKDRIEGQLKMPNPKTLDNQNTFKV